MQLIKINHFNTKPLLVTQIPDNAGSSGVAQLRSIQLSPITLDRALDPAICSIFSITPDVEGRSIQRPAASSVHPVLMVGKHVFSRQLLTLADKQN